jgi:hypothetical protein
LASFSSPLNEAWFVGKRDRIWFPLRKQTSLGGLREAGRRLRADLRPGDLLLTQDAYLAVEAGLRVPRGLEMGPFSYFPDWSDAQAAACHVMNRVTLRHLLATTDASMAAFSGYGLSIAAPGIRPLPEDEQRELRGCLRERYAPAWDVDKFGQAETKLEVFRLRR